MVKFDVEAAEFATDGGCDLFLPQLCSPRRDEPDQFSTGIAYANLLGDAV